MSEHEKEAALAFARSKPTEWDAFYTQWLNAHSEQPTVIEGLELPEATVTYGTVSKVSDKSFEIEDEDSGKKRRIKKSEP